MKLMKGKFLRSGKVLEVIEWDTPIGYDYTAQPHIRGSEASEDWIGKADKNLKRAQIALRRLIWSNQTRYSKFVTFTYKDAEPDMKRVRSDWKAFQQRMTREGYRIDYVAVLEWQEQRELKLGEKSLHIHAVLFTDRYIPCDFISKAWKKGFIKINATRDIKNMGLYVAKYLTKTTLAKYGSHSYFCSKGLKRPEEQKMSSHEDLWESLEELKAKGKRVFIRDFIIASEDAEGNKREIKSGTYQQFILD